MSGDHDAEVKASEILNGLFSQHLRECCELLPDMTRGDTDFYIGDRVMARGEKALEYTIMLPRNLERTNPEPLPEDETARLDRFFEEYAHQCAHLFADWFQENKHTLCIVAAPCVGCHESGFFVTMSQTGFPEKKHPCHGGAAPPE